MRTILFVIKSFYYLLLFSLFIFLALFPTDEYWNIISAVLFWLIIIGYLIRVYTRNIMVDQLMKHGLVFFVAGSVISSLGIFVAGEIFLKLSFLVFILGIIGSFISYKSING